MRLVLTLPRVDARPLRPTALAIAATAVLGALAIAGTGFRELDPVEALGGGSIDPELRRVLRPARTGVYVVVDRTNNRIQLRNGERLLLDAACSAGSGWVLRDPVEGRTWVFDTPRGAFTVRDRIENPVWRKPDWAFLEIGEPLPEDPGERIEYGTLGEYALVLGDGYMIHGTLYERLLGRSVTHGCIRVGRDDLRVLWRRARVGTPVLVF